jgi:serine/threonine protein kinase
MAGLTLGAEFAGYVIESVIGRGGMGVIYRASQLQPERPVALKVASTTRPASPKTTTVVKTVVVQQSAPLTTAPVTGQASASAQVTATGGWPAGTSAWTVVLKSASTQADAEQAASSASAAGVSETGVLLSADHSSLRPGYWVAFSGVLTHDEADARTTAAHAAGFSDAYVRYVSAN